MRKRTLVIITAAVVGLGIVALLIWALLPRGGPRGGTPIIIKGWGDQDLELAIEGSPNGQVQGPTGKDHHLRNWPISTLYVLDASQCVEYQLNEKADSRFEIWVANNQGQTELDIDLSHSATLKRMDLFFDDYDVYRLDPDSKYRRKQPRAIKKVIATFASDTGCFDKTGNEIKCPGEFTDLKGEVTIGVNRDKSKRCTP